MAKKYGDFSKIDDSTWNNFLVNKLNDGVPGAEPKAVLSEPPANTFLGLTDGKMGLTSGPHIHIENVSGSNRQDILDKFRGK